MILELDDDWRVRSDEHSWIVERRRIPKTGKNAGVVQWVAMTYWRTFEMALDGWVDTAMRNSAAEGFPEIVGELSRLRRQVRGLAEKFEQATEAAD